MVFVASVVLIGSAGPAGLNGLFGRSSLDRPTLAALDLEEDATPTPQPPRPIVERRELATPTATPAPELVTHAPAGSGLAANELGRIPILMYHAFVHDPAYTDEWTLTFDQFREQLDWLVQNDFVMVGLNSIIDRNVDIPAGKRPVVLTFDDASAGQFGLEPAPGGGYEVKPDSAVGILEEYRQRYPEFAGPAFFAVLSFNCFASEGDPSTCEERLTWMIEHGYEIGNHTRGHQNLTDVSVDLLKVEIVEPILWFGERIDGKNNLADVLVLPYGAYPAKDDLRALLFEGFWLKGKYYLPKLVLEVAGGPARSPYHIDWAPNQTRYNTYPETFWYWADQIETGGMDIFVSDGDPATVTIPAGWEGALNEERCREDGRRVVVRE